MAGLYPHNSLGELLLGANAPIGLGGLNALARAPLVNALGLGLPEAASQPKKVPRTYPCFELYVDSKMEWRWRYLASNYKTIADSGEGYKNFEDAKHGIALLHRCAQSPTYIGRD